MKYQKDYGWNFGKRKPDFARCAANVSQSDGWHSGQCKRKAKFDPDENGNPTTCKQHCEATEAAKKAKHDAEYADYMARAKAASERRKFERHARTFFDALQSIAGGHNDPRSLAQETIASFLDAEKPEGFDDPV